MSQVVQVALLGVTGRLGRAIGKAVLQAPDFALSGAVVRAGSPSEGEDIGDWLIGQPATSTTIM